MTNIIPDGSRIREKMNGGRTIPDREVPRVGTSGNTLVGNQWVWGTG